MSTPDESSAWATVFDRAADSYDLAPLSFFDRHADTVIRELRIRPGDRLLDVATGTGKVAIRAAEAAGASGWVAGVDVSPAMIHVARAKRMSPSIRYAVMDARRLGFRDASFDGLACAFGLTFMRPNVVHVVREMRRVLRPSGLLVVATFADGAFSPLLDSFLAALEGVGVPRPRPTSPRWMLLDRRRHLARALRRGGLTRTRTFRSETTSMLLEPDDFWTVLNGTAWRSALGRLPADVSAQVRDALVRGFEAVRDREGVRLDTSALIGVGMRPPARRGSAAAVRLGVGARGGSG